MPFPKLNCIMKFINRYLVTPSTSLNWAKTKYWTWTTSSFSDKFQNSAKFQLDFILSWNSWFHLIKLTYQADILIISTPWTMSITPERNPQKYFSPDRWNTMRAPASPSSVMNAANVRMPTRNWTFPAVSSSSLEGVTSAIYQSTQSYMTAVYMTRFDVVHAFQSSHSSNVTSNVSGCSELMKNNIEFSSYGRRQTCAVVEEPFR